MNDATKSVFRSLFITLVVSGVVSILLWTVGFDLYKSAIFAFIGQLVFFYGLNTILQSRSILRSKELENVRIAEYSKQGTIVSCATCNADNFIPLRFDIDNEFECEACESKNSVYINITTAQATSPLDVNSLTVSTYIREKTEALGKIETLKNLDDTSLDAKELDENE